MPITTMETKRLRLLPNELTHMQTLRQGVAAFSAKFGLAVAEGFADFQQPEDRDAMVTREWDSFLLWHRAEQMIIGACACRKLPDAAGAVEIAYGIVPGFRGQGLATEAAQALVQRAFDRSDVKAVVANTLAEQNASTRVLSKCGFKHVGDTVDDDEGVVWKWERAR